jgi:hypothetical protein
MQARGHQDFYLEANQVQVLSPLVEIAIIQEIVRKLVGKKW